MPPHAAPFRLAAPAAAALLAVLAAAASPARADPLPGGVGAPLLVDDEARGAAPLPLAQDRAARASAAVDDLKRELAPGHLTDPMPDVDRAFGLASLRSDYADAQRRAAGYRATLGDQHPTLLATEQVMAELRAQLLDGTRKALASAEREAAGARAAVTAAERRAAPGPTARVAAASAAVRAADATGSVAAPARPAARTGSPLSLPPAPAERRVAAEAPQARAAAPAHRLWSILAAVLAAAAATALLAAWAAFRLLRPRRPRTAPAAMPRVEPALAAPAAEAEVSAAAVPAAPRGAPPAHPVPVLSRLALPRSVEALSAVFAAPAIGTGGAAAELHATLRAAFGDAAAARMTVLVAPAAGLPGPDADNAALALALAAAADGRRPLLMEARAAGRLRGTLVPPAAAPVLVEAGGTTRTLYRLGPAEAPVGLLPSDVGEAEAALAAAARPGTARLRGLDAFDTVVLVGDDAATLVASADLLLLAAPARATAEALAAAALPLRGAGRPCGAVLIEPVAPARAAPQPRRRPAADAPAPRLGLRGSIAPQRRRVGA